MTNLLAAKRGTAVRYRESRGLLGAIFALWAASPAVAQDVRLTAPLDAGWRFMQAQDLAGAEAPGFVAAVEDARLYDSYREGDFHYRVPLPNGQYRVHLKFEDPTASAAGERIFDAEANGTTQLKEFDVFKAVGGKLQGSHSGRGGVMRWYRRSRSRRLLRPRASASRR
jgi:Malectin domain